MQQSSRTGNAPNCFVICPGVVRLASCTWLAPRAALGRLLHRIRPANFVISMTLMPMLNQVIGQAGIGTLLGFAYRIGRVLHRHLRCLKCSIQDIGNFTEVRLTSGHSDISGQRSPGKVVYCLKVFIRQPYFSDPPIFGIKVQPAGERIKSVARVHQQEMKVQHFCCSAERRTDDRAVEQPPQEVCVLMKSLRLAAQHLFGKSQTQQGLPPVCRNRFRHSDLLQSSNQYGLRTPAPHKPFQRIRPVFPHTRGGPSRHRLGFNKGIKPHLVKVRGLPARLRFGIGALHASFRTLDHRRIDARVGQLCHTSRRKLCPSRKDSFPEQPAEARPRKYAGASVSCSGSPTA